MNPWPPSERTQRACFAVVGVDSGTIRWKSHHGSGPPDFSFLIGLSLCHPKRKLPPPSGWQSPPSLMEMSLVGWDSSMPFKDTTVPSFLQLHVTPGPISQCLSPELLLMHTGHC